MLEGLGVLLNELIFRNRDRHSIPAMDGPLRPNEDLDRFQVICDSLSAPDDIAIDSDGALYVSTNNQVIKFYGKNYQSQAVYAEFEEGCAGGLSFHSDGRLMVCVGGAGLAVVSKTQIVEWIKTAEGEPIRCPTSAVSGQDGKIYIAEGSTLHDPYDWVWDLMEKNSAGRLIVYDEDKDTTQVLLSNLSYPYGLTFSQDNKAIVMTESWKHCISIYPSDAIRSASQRLVVPNLPGYPARIVKSRDGGYWVSLFAMRTNLVEFILTENKYRREMMRRIDPAHWVAPTLRAGQDILEPLQGGGIKQLGITKPWAPPRSYGLVIKLDDNFEPELSFHSRVDGKRHGITGTDEFDGALYAVSKGHDVILRQREANP